VPRAGSSPGGAAAPNRRTGRRCPVRWRFRAARRHGHVTYTGARRSGWVAVGSAAQSRESSS
jgi:hypothetical protein